MNIFSANPAAALAAPKRNTGGFTMIEIAICLAIIGFALVAIIGVLPLGMNTQRDNREETLINQDASVLLETIRSGARGSDDLTNFVYAITNSWVWFNADGSVKNSSVDGYTRNTAYVFGATVSSMSLTNGTNIIGILSTPEFTAGFGGKPMSDTFGKSYVSNHVVAYIRTISGLAAEKPPQNNTIMLEDTLAYRLFCVNAPMPVDTNSFNDSLYARSLAGNQRELRLTFLWPQLPNGKLGNGHQTFRATVGGQLVTVPNAFQSLYYYQSQLFTTNAP